MIITLFAIINAITMNIHFSQTTAQALPIMDIAIAMLIIYACAFAMIIEEDATISTVKRFIIIYGIINVLSYPAVAILIRTTDVWPMMQ